MIIVKYQAGALGNFLCSILHNDIKPVAKLDYENQNKIFHTGSYENIGDIKFKKDTNPLTKSIISHNNPKLQDWIDNLVDCKNIFIALNSHFVEYRLNYISKMPQWNHALNQYAIYNSWKDYPYPVACDDARRIFRLHNNNEQMIKVNQTKDTVFDFGNFYIDTTEEWVDAFRTLTKQIRVTIADSELALWFENFQQGQASIIERAKLLYDCIESKKFTPDLTENEKGIIIGYYAVADCDNTAEYFIETYESFQV